MVSGAITGAVLGTACHWLHNAIKPAHTVAAVKEELELLMRANEAAAAAAQQPRELRAVRPEERWEAWQNRRKTNED